MIRPIALASGVLALLVNPALASDGVIEINQVAVFAGGITPGDLPGFPATLSLSASYRLTGTLDVTKDASGGTQSGAENITAVAITARDATLDLNGFSIVGPATCSGMPPGSQTVCTPSGMGRGVDAANADGVTVRNGTIRGMGAAGVFTGEGAQIAGVRAVNNAGTGIGADSFAIISGCSALANGSDGIFLGSGLVERSVSSENGGNGINVAAGATVSGNTVSVNFGAGITLNAGPGTMVGNTAQSNGSLGLAGPAGAGYAHNALNGNNGGNANPQAGGATQMPPNVCGGDLTCP